MQQIDLNESLKWFLHNFYWLEVVNDEGMARSSREFLASEKYKERADEIKKAFTELMQTRSLSTEDYEWITDVEFEKTGDLYDYYLQGIYDFLFSGATRIPLPLQPSGFTYGRGNKRIPIDTSPIYVNIKN